MVKCSAYGCDNTTTKNIPELSFHRFPKNKEKKDAWTNALRIKSWAPKASSLVCSAHFEDCFINRTLETIRLKDDAVPSIFPAFPPYLEIKPDPVTQSSSHQKLIESMPCNTPTGQTIVDCKYCDKYIKTIEALKNNAKKKQRKIKTLQESRSRYLKKIARCEEVIEELKAKLTSAG